MKAHYFLRLPEQYDDYFEALNARDDIENKSDLYKSTLFQMLRPGYYVPKIQFKSWVPNWVIRLITKKP